MNQPIPRMMKHILLNLAVFLVIAGSGYAQVSINTDGSLPDAKAMLDVKGTTGGFLPPRMTQAEMMAIPSPPAGLLVYCSDCNTDGCLNMYFNGAWNCYDQLTINKPPFAQNVTQGSLSVFYGDTLTGLWSYFDCELDAQGPSEYQWFRADDPNGANETAIVGATDVSYVTTFADGGKFVRFAVMPSALTGYSPGILTKALAFTRVETENTAPVATDLRISGGYAVPSGSSNTQFVNIGDVLTATFTYADFDGDLPGAHLYQWYTDTDTLPGGVTAISGATSVDYVVTASNAGKYIKFGVTPVALTGESPGAQVKSHTPPDNYRFVNRQPGVSSVLIQGVPGVGNSIYINYSYTDSDRDPEGPATFKWYRATNILGTGEETIAGATSSYYTIQTGDIGYFLRCSVTPTALSGSTPGQETKSAKFSAPVGEPMSSCAGTISYGTVDEGGVTWLDRNLGASRVAQTPNDYFAYGSLYQWGRQNDGHQCINWNSATTGIPEYGTTSTLCSGGTCPNELFVTTSGNADWNSPTNNSLWNGTSKGVNDPCPSGYRVPTKDELTALAAGFYPTSSQGAFASSLKMPVPGVRSYALGDLASTGTTGYYWSSTVNTSVHSYYMVLSLGEITIPYNSRTFGYSVRCIAQ